LIRRDDCVAVQKTGKLILNRFGQWHHLN
jgi:hypothetical protein